MKTRNTHTLYWLSIPFLFFWLYIQIEDEADLYLFINDGFIKILGFVIWSYISMYFFVVGSVYYFFDSPKESFFKTYFFNIFNTFSILFVHLFFLTMLENKTDYDLIILDGNLNPNINIYETKRALFYFFFSIWSSFQIVFWMKILWRFLKKISRGNLSSTLNDILDVKIE